MKETRVIIVDHKLCDPLPNQMIFKNNFLILSSEDDAPNYDRLRSDITCGVRRCRLVSITCPQINQI